MTWDDFLPQVLPSTVGCPDLLALDHIVKAARELCARTLVWNYSCVAIPAVAGIADYTLQIGAEEELVRVLLVEVDGTEYSIPSGVRGRQATRRGDSNICTMRGLHDFTLAPAPQLSGLEIITDVAVKPKLGATTWPDDFAEYVEDISRGAIASLCALPKVGWTDMQTASIQRGLFDNRLGTIASKVAKGMGRSRRHAAIGWY